MTTWIETIANVYLEIYAEHGRDFTVWSSVWCSNSSSDQRCTSYTSETEYATAWGFKRADYPLIKKEKRGETLRYFLALNERETDVGEKQMTKSKQEAVTDGVELPPLPKPQDYFGHGG